MRHPQLDACAGMLLQLATADIAYFPCFHCLWIFPYPETMECTACDADMTQPLQALL